MSNFIKKLNIYIYTHRRHRTVRLPAQVLHHLLHNSRDGGGGKAGGGRRYSGGGQGGGVVGGADGVGHPFRHLPYHLLHHRRDVDGGVVDQVRAVDRGGDDGGGGVIDHLLVDGGQVVTRRHLLRVPLDLLPQGHHVLYKFGRCGLEEVRKYTDFADFFKKICCIFLVYSRIYKIFT